MLRESEERFRHMAQHDALTGLPTRMLLHDRLQVALERGKRFKTNLALLMIDLDNFKHVNDSLGHDAGDQTLRTIAKRLLSAIRSSDTAARMGGDEFLVLLTDVADEDEAESVASRIRVALSVPIQLSDHEIPVSASIGVCVVSDGAIDAAMLLKKADVAMYHAKARGRNCFEVFSGQLTGPMLNKLELQTGLGHALARYELELHYQPMVSFESGRVMGFEALLRWRSHEHGLILPNDFIPVAEESGLIIPIGDWVLCEATRQIAELERQYGEIFLLAVNLSPRQLLRPELVQMIEQTLVASGRPVGSLALEITETTVLSDAQPVRETLARIRDLGVQLAIDDFGIGFSSLSYITRFPADWIKLDRSLICNCTTDPASLAVLRAIVAIAHALGIRLVAEGVETKEQYLLLKQEQCNVVQGYYLSRPLALTDLSAFLASSIKHADPESLIRPQPSIGAPSIMGLTANTLLPNAVEAS
jgi:diguanylate cyclase (GGDEF)-like protein